MTDINHHAGNFEAVTEPGSHVATKAGYADGRIIAEGEHVPHGIAVCPDWMEEAPKAPKAKAKAEAAE